MQDGGAAESAMGDEEFLAESLASDGRDDFSGESGEIAPSLLIGLVEDERD